jgi:hypothetical protein
MDFLKDIEDYHTAMENAYAFITKRITMDTVYEDLDNKSISLTPANKISFLTLVIKSLYFVINIL